MAANSVTVNVRDHHKQLRFAELITTGSIYALTVEGATIASGALFLTCNIRGEEKLVAYATIANNAGSLSTNTAELKQAMAHLPVGAMRSFFCVIHRDGATEYENVATGTVNIANAGGTWSDTTTGAAILYKGEKGDKGDTGETGATGAAGISPSVSVTQFTGGHTVTITDASHPQGQSFNVLDGCVSPQGQYVQAPTAQGGDGKWHRVVIADGALAFEDTGIDDPPEPASKGYVADYVASYHHTVSDETLYI